MNERVMAQTVPPAAASAFSPGEWQALRALREGYHAGHELFSGAELARLHFVRWLYKTGRVGSVCE